MKYEDVDCIHIDEKGYCKNEFTKKNIFGVCKCPKLILNHCALYEPPVETKKIDREEVEFQCKCKKASGWIAEGEETKQGCPECGRRYRGKYDSNKNTIVAIEIK